MIRASILAIVAASALVSASSADDSTRPSTPARALAGKSLADWVEALTPPPADLAWETIPWHASFSDGLIAADRAERPLLLWLMNGHPLGCT